MQIELVPDSTDVIEISTEYHTTLRIDDNYNIEVTFIELLLNLNDEENMQVHITTDFEVYPEHLTIDQIFKLQNDVKEFVNENIRNLIKDSGKPE